MRKLFVWIPKTAGTAIFSQLQKEGMKLYLENNLHEFNNEGDACFGHFDVKALIKCRVISKEYWDNCKPFCVVRNPYARFVSLYNDFLKSGRIFPNTTIRKFATTLPTLTRKPGYYNVKDFSQAASQIEWLFPGIEIRRFEDIVKDLPHLNRSTDNHWMTYYDNELLKMVTDIYYDGITMLNYPIIERKDDFLQ